MRLKRGRTYLYTYYYTLIYTDFLNTLRGTAECGPSPGAMHQLMSAQRRAVPREWGLVDSVSGFRVQMDAPLGFFFFVILILKF